MCSLRVSEYDKKVRKSILEKLRFLYKHNKITVNDLESMHQNKRITAAESVLSRIEEDGSFIIPGKK